MRFIVATLQLLALLLVMTGCSSTSATSGVVETAPILTAEKICPPEATAALPDTPLPPPGIDAEQLLAGLIDALGPEQGTAVWVFMMTEERPYSRELRGRLQAIQDACVSK